LSEILDIVAYQPWIASLLVGIATVVYVLVFVLRKRLSYVIGGFLIVIASILLFFGLFTLFSMKYLI
jgi:hypothetical protein